MRQDCKVPENKIYCAHCKTRKHNTYVECPSAPKKEKGDKKGNSNNKGNGDKKRTKGKGRGGRRLRSLPPPDKARKAEGDEADLEDYDDSDKDNPAEGGYSGSALCMQLVIGSIARMEASLGDDPPEGESQTEPPLDTTDDGESTDDEPSWNSNSKMPPLATNDESTDDEPPWYSVENEPSLDSTDDESGNNPPGRGLLASHHWTPRITRNP